MAESSFVKAARHQAKLRLALMGATGTGKTYSALLLALGIGGKIAMIDTEHGRGEVYSHLGEYFVSRLDPPFKPERYTEKIREAEKEGFDVIIIDSLTHAWRGRGGTLDILNEVAKARFSGNTWAAWSVVTPQHSEMMDAIIRSSAHVIATIRSTMAYVQSEDGGKKKMEALGMKPQQRDGTEYEFTLALNLDRENMATPFKLMDGLYDSYDPFKITEESGLKILEWLEQGEPMPEPTFLGMDELVNKLPELSEVSAITRWCTEQKASIDRLPKEQKDALRKQVQERKQEILAGKGKQE